MEWIHGLSTLYNTIRPVLDILILAFLVYKGYELLVKTQAIQLVKGAGLLVLLYGFAYFFRLSTLQWILSLLAPGLFIALAIVFQPELRKIIMRLGQTELFHINSKQRMSQIDAAVTAADLLAKQKRGALMVFPRKINIKSIIDTGTRLNAELSTSLIVTIFAYDGPLHDGAIIIQNGHIIAAGTFLPLSEQQDIRKSFGTRHRAALGVSEQTDAVVLVVSEETGAISLAYEGRLYYDLSLIEILQTMKKLLEDQNPLLEEGPEEEGKHGIMEVR
uniref:Diadenylate cyclase n=1 Tax=Gracilinema caldarium TaxID=215591 RepID=A0A7C3IEU5_9SPIR